MKKSSIITPHPAAPRKLIALYKKFRGNCYRLGKHLGVNPAHIWKLLKYGKEPKRLDLREKLFLKVPRKKKEPVQQELPEYIKKWNKLLKDERWKAIQEYISWRNKDGQK